MSDADGETPDRLQQALDDGIDKLRNAGLSGYSRAVALVAFTVLKGRDRDKVLRAVEMLRRDLRQVDSILKEVLTRGQQEQDEEAEAKPYETAWLSRLSRRLRQEPQAEIRHAMWLDAWAEALAASAWDACADIVGMADGRRDAEMAPDLTWVAECLRDGVPGATLPVLRRLLGRGDQPSGATITLLVLTSRAARRFGGRIDESTELAARALELSTEPPGVLHSLALAALAEAHLAAGRRRDAERVLDHALETEVGTVDLILAVARLATMRGQYRRANDYFDVTAQRFGAASVKAHLLREIPGNLLWRTARRVRLTDPGSALRFYNRALHAGIVGPGDHPDRKVLVEKAKLLDELGRKKEAAHVYRLAADRYSLSKSTTATPLYDLARRLDPDVAEHHWLYGEALRASVSAEAPEASERLLREAKDALEHGFRLSAPDRETAWALVSAAVVSSELDEGADVFLMVERALLLDPASPRALAFLVTLLRDRGYPREATAATDPARVIDAGDDVLATRLALAWADLGRYDEAAAVIEDYRVYWAATDAQLQLLAGLHLRRGSPELALQLLGGGPRDGGVPTSMLRAICYARLDRPDDERAALQELVEGRDVDQDSTAWAEYRLGHLDRSIQLFTELVQKTPTVSRKADVQMHLGLVLLVRGADGSDDVQKGRGLLVGAVEWTNHADDLVQVLDHQVPFVREDVRGAAHEKAVEEALTDFTRRAKDRIAALRERTRPSSDMAVRLASARRALQEQRGVEALDLYSEIVADGGPTETASGLDAAARIVLEEGDGLLEKGSADAARERWERVAAVCRLPGLTSADARRLASRAEARTALSLIDEDASGLRVTDALSSMDAETVQEAFTVVTSDLSRAWRTYDLLRTTAAPGTTDRRPRVPELPLTALYRTRHEEIAGAALQPFTGAVGLAVGGGSRGLDRQELRQGIEALRQQLADELGVLLPGVRTYVDDDLPADTARFLVYDALAGEVVVPAEEPSPSAVVLEAFEHVLRENMFRWVTADDVDLWAEGWDVDAADQSDELWIPGESWARYRLARLLRMLLREGVPVRDRGGILRAFREAEEAGRTATVDALEVVRTRLYPTTCGPAPVPPVTVPDGLQRRVAAGLTELETGARAWTLPRSTTTDLVHDIRTWRATLPPGPVAAQVRDGRIRLALWRLLAADRPRVYVLAEAETP